MFGELFFEISMPLFWMISFSISEMSLSAIEVELRRLRLIVSMKLFRAVESLWLELRELVEDSSRSVWNWTMS